eukprot:TRINITY_DN4387_c0_g1_i9.p1 TRINITY_DN4387_c0_g1~~TRINITY_DN4387_c0_g1_i9.p1  ORF type:complete len:499 (-),score=92.98 TRINITY_DN4387_c0_g1_i9:3-1322(-)
MSRSKKKQVHGPHTGKPATIKVQPQEHVADDDVPSSRGRKRERTEGFSLPHTTPPPHYHSTPSRGQRRSLFSLIPSFYSSLLTQIIILLTLLIIAIVVIHYFITYNVRSLVEYAGVPFIAAFSALSSIPSSLKGAYCHLPFAPFCPEPLAPIAQIARTVSDQAVRASTIFESVLALGDPASIGLHQTEIWELGIAIKSTTELEDKDFLGDQLKDLGHLTRDVKDSMMQINSIGINSFVFILHEFARIEDIIDHIYEGKTDYSTKTIEKNLDSLFIRIGSDFGRLLDSVERTLLSAEHASELGRKIMEHVSTEHMRLQRMRTDKPLWRWLADVNSWKGKQLSRDIMLMEQSIFNLRDIHRRLEESRNHLVKYRDNASEFKASITGWHLADHGLSPADEVKSLNRIMQSFAHTVKEARARSLPSPSSEDAQKLPDKIWATM